MQPELLTALTLLVIGLGLFFLVVILIVSRPDPERRRREALLKLELDLVGLESAYEQARILVEHPQITTLGGGIVTRYMELPPKIARTKARIAQLKAQAPTQTG